jgi:hypothetical protein
MLMPSPGCWRAAGDLCGSLCPSFSASAGYGTILGRKRGTEATVASALTSQVEAMEVRPDKEGSRSRSVNQGPARRAGRPTLPRYPANTSLSGTGRSALLPMKYTPEAPSLAPG